MAAADASSFCNLIQFVPQLTGKERETEQKNKTACTSEVDECGEDIKHFYEALVSSDAAFNSQVTDSNPEINVIKTNKKDKLDSVSPEINPSSLITACNNDKVARPRKRERTVSSKLHEHKAATHQTSTAQNSYLPHSQTFKLLQAAQMGELKQVSALLTKGVNVNCQDYFGWTPLMVAAKQGNDEIVQYLLKHGCDHTVSSLDGHTAVTLARLGGHEHIVATILDYSRCDLHERIATSNLGAEQEPDLRPDDVAKEKSSGGTYFCQICKREVSLSEKSHETSTVHLFNSGHKSKQPSYLLPETNKGFDMLLKMGWQVDKGLGPHGDGPKYPVKTVLKLDRKGLGIDNCAKKKAKITHFNPNDKSAIEHRSEIPVRTISARKAAQFANKAKEKRDRQRERRLRFEFNDR
ncbi:unnamed protein product [Candidula unifasciata]|uniref:G-patch domain-containing protein n=1 Tax=Candidula unifasciata TaxID=100452 RepID=A0A8S3ZTT7_9EUPU|nr:unnamed protein product [Candidula unifasciata]